MQKIGVRKMTWPEQIKEPNNVRSMILTTKIKVIKRKVLKEIGLTS